MSKEKRTKAQLKAEANATITMFIDEYMKQFCYNVSDCLPATYGNSKDGCPDIDVPCNKCNRDWVENKRKELLDKYLLK